MVSKASDDFPDPLNPVMTVKVFRGISTSIFFRLCCRAPCTVMRSSKQPFSHSVGAAPHAFMSQDSLERLRISRLRCTGLLPLKVGEAIKVMEKAGETARTCATSTIEV